ncbi:MAG: serine/threonine protein kinase [Phycisphaerales bacterium]|nr:MAG: serine/threonine protein kinase [Phycisphaerales bacterium]
MAPEVDHPGIRALFESLVDLSAEERAEALARAEHTDAAVAARVTRLLIALESGPELPPVFVFDEPEGADRLLSDGCVVSTPIGPVRIMGLLSDPARLSVSQVYEAHHTDAGRIALKLLPEAGTGHEARRRFLAETEALRSLDHPHVARLLSAGPIESGDAPGCMGILTRFVDGQALDEWASGRDAGEIVSVVATVARAVHHVHLRQILHRDLKPSNIIVMPDGRPVLLDLGIAKFLDPKGPNPYATIGRSVAGTPAYMAPEQLTPTSARVDYRADQYALGAMLYELLVGRALVTLSGQSEAEMYRLKMGARPPALRGLSVRALAVQAALVAASPHAEDRYPAADRFADDLDRAASGRPLSVRPMGRARRLLLIARRRPVAAIAVTLAVAALTAWGATFVVAQHRIDAARARAEARFSDTRAFAHWAIFELTDQLSSIANTTVVRHNLIEQATEMLERLAHDPFTDQELLLELIEGYARLGEILDEELGDKAGATARYEAGRLLLQRPTLRASPEVMLMQVWLDFLIMRAHDAPGYRTLPKEKLEKAIRSMDRIQQARPNDHRLYRYRARLYWSLATYYRLNDGPAEKAVEAMDRSVADAEIALKIAPDDSFVQLTWSYARFWRSSVYFHVDDPRYLDAIEDAIAAARTLEQLGHASAGWHTSRAMLMRCRVFAKQVDRAGFLHEARPAIQIADQTAAQNPDQKLPNRHAEIIRINLARATLESDGLRDAPLLNEALEWAREGWAMWEQRSARGWATADEQARYPELYQKLIRDLENAVAQ